MHSNPTILLNFLLLSICLNVPVFSFAFAALIVQMDYLVWKSIDFFCLNIIECGRERYSFVMDVFTADGLTK